jgi:hypothetical protein
VERSELLDVAYEILLFLLEYSSLLNGLQTGRYLAFLDLKVVGASNKIRSSRGTGRSLCCLSMRALGTDILKLLLIRC